MCQNIASEVNENRRDIPAIKAHIGLPLDNHRELPEFDDPFAEWDAADAAAATQEPNPFVPLPRQHHRQTSRTAHAPRRPLAGQEIFDEDDEETEEEEPHGYKEHRDSDENEDTSDDIPNADE